LSGQSFNKNDFFEADMALVSNNFERAQRIFERLLKAEPGNANLNFLNGLCLINIPGRKKESLPYFKRAAPEASSDYKYGDPQELNAPIEVIKYFAMASKLNDDITGAIELFNQYKTLLSSKEQDEITLIDDMIESCYTALQLKGNPVFFTKHDLGNNLKSNESQLYPVVNNDETMLFYSERGKFNKDDIYFSQKINGVWTAPVKITVQLGVKSECYPSSVSFDNERLYLTVKTGVSTDIYYSVFSKNRWQKMIKMGKPVNGKGWDSQACESPDGNYLYFSSDRKGGLGNMDLYRSQKDVKGKWMKPVNLGETINTAQNELMPIVNADQSKLYFKSEGFENIGGYDIFVSEAMGDNEWSRPVNMGYPLNTTDDDIYYMPVGEGNYIYAAVENPDNNFKTEITYLEILPDDQSRNFEIAGLIILQDNADGYDDVNIEVYSTASYEAILTTQPDKQTGNYSFELGSGAYMINYVKPDYKIYTQLIDLSENPPEDVLVINAILDKEEPIVEVVPTFVETETIEEIAPDIKTEAVPEVILEEEIQAVENPEPEYEPLPVETAEEPVEYPAEIKNEGRYTIQIMASLKELNLTSINEPFTIEVQKGDDRYYRYITGTYNTIADAEITLNKIIKATYNDAFIRPYKLDDYLSYVRGYSAEIYTIQLMAIKREINTSYFKGLSGIKISHGDDGFYRYTLGEFNTLQDAQQELENISANGYPNSFIKKTVNVSNY